MMFNDEFFADVTKEKPSKIERIASLFGKKLYETFEILSGGERFKVQFKPYGLSVFSEAKNGWDSDPQLLEDLINDTAHVVETMKSCPFCGSETKLRVFEYVEAMDGRGIKIKPTPQIWCRHCKITFELSNPNWDSLEEHKAELIKAWNKRV